MLNFRFMDLLKHHYNKLSYIQLYKVLEQKDNKKFDIFKTIIPRNQEFIVKHKPELLGGINIITRKNSTNEIFTAIPYFV